MCEGTAPARAMFTVTARVSGSRIWPRQTPSGVWSIIRVGTSTTLRGNSAFSTTRDRPR